MHIVPTGMHVFAIDKQRIKIRTHEGSGSFLCGLIAHNSGDAVAPNSGGHLDIKALEGGVDGCGCAFFLVGKLGVFVEVVVKGLLPGKICGVVIEKVGNVLWIGAGL